MELIENSCSSCGKIGHHRQEYSRQNNTDSYSISRLWKRVIKDSKDVHQKGKADVYCSPLPVSVVRKCLDNSIDYYFRKNNEIQDIGLPGITVKETVEQKTSHHMLHLQILEFRKSDDHLWAYLKQKPKLAHASEDERLIFEGVLDSFKELRHQVYEISKKMSVWSFFAHASVIAFWNQEHKFQQFLRIISKVLSGRPTYKEALQLNDTINQAARSLAAMTKEGKNLRNICNPESVKTLKKMIRVLQIRLGKLQQKSREIEIQSKEGVLHEEVARAMDQFKLEFEKMKSKLTCSICCDNQIYWVLKCGHVYCEHCVTKLEELTVHHHSMEMEDGWIWESDVEMTAECPNRCEGGLKEKIRIYFP